MKKTFLLLLTLFFLDITAVKASRFEPNNQDHFSITYDKCENIMRVSVFVYSLVGSDDYMEHFDLRYRVNGGTWVNFFEVRRNAVRNNPSRHSNYIQFHSHNHSYYYVNDASNITVATNRGNPSRHVSVFANFRLPQEFLGANVQVEISNIRWRQRYGNGSSQNHYPNNASRFPMIPAIPSISGFSASTDQCSQVLLAWNLQNPNDFCDLEERFVEVVRDNVAIARANYGPGQFIDINKPYGYEAQYLLRSVYSYDQNNRNSPLARIGEDSPLLMGGTIPNPDPITGLTASTDRCNEVRIRWDEISDVNIQSPIKVFYSSNPSTLESSSPSANAIDVEADQNTATIPWADDNGLMKYRIQVTNNCDRKFITPVQEASLVQFPVAVTDLVATPVVAENQITLSWTDPLASDDYRSEANFIIRRINNQDLSDVQEFTIDPNITTYEDRTMRNCIPYTYSIISKNLCDQITSSSVPTSLDGNLSNFMTEGGFSISKGYFANHILLEWRYNGSNRLIDKVEIHRRDLGSANSHTRIASLDPSTTRYEDQSANPNILQEYFIQGVRENCGMPGNNIYSNTVTEVGFRIPSGIITGAINFDGGNPVKGVQVIATTADPSVEEACVAFDGNTGTYLELDPENLLLNTLTFEVWVHASDWNQNAYILNHSSYKLQFSDTGEVIFRITTEGNNSYSVRKTHNLTTGWHHFAGAFDGSTMALYIDGRTETALQDEVCDNCVISYTNNSDFFVLGANNDGSNAFNGRMDELRIWNYGKTLENVEQDYNIKVPSGSEGLALYFNFDENVGENAYDKSHLLNSYNENHAVFNGGISWSNDIPTQLSLAGITKEDGTYSIEDIYFGGSLSIYNFTPVLGVHSFTPNTAIRSIGNGALTANIDFTDDSSFRVTGSVRYENTTCAAEGIIISVDGTPLVMGSDVVRTDVNGQFDISVPIGSHYISVSLSGHEFSVGRWPTDGSLHNFNSPVTGIEFLDNTEILVRGRVVGGSVEAEKDLGFNKSTNNIGRASIIYTSLNSCFSKADTTNVNSGEYLSTLPPLPFTVATQLINNPSISFGSLRMLDLSVYSPRQQFVNTVLDEEGNVESEESVEYNYINSYTHYSDLEINVSSLEDDNDFGGDVTYTDVSNDTQVDISDFSLPIFQQGNRAVARISIEESYLNYDDDINNPVINTVPVTGSMLNIKNNLSAESEEFMIDMQNKSDTLYVFNVGLPSFVENGLHPEYSYSKTFEITTSNEASGTTRRATWEPRSLLSGDRGDQYFRGYILGAIPLGSSFLTQGPEVVEHILRDPPGSESFVSLSEASKMSISHNWTLGNSSMLNINTVLATGASFSVGVGFVTSTQIQNVLTAGITVQGELKGGQTFVETTTLNKTWSTSFNPEQTGADSDVFIGNSRNFEFGESAFLELLPVDVCLLEGVNCYGAAHNGYKLGKREGFYLVPDGYATTFIYTQTHIRDILIPSIKNLRNNVIINNAAYTSNLTSDHSNYGKNNDDPVWGDMATTDNHPISDDLDNTGPSYTFDPMIQTPNFPQDSIRWYNQQIRIWEEALQKNEKEKVDLISDPSADIENFSLSTGTSFSRQVTSSNSKAGKVTFELALTLGIKNVTTAMVAGSGVQVEQLFSNTTNTGYGFEEVEENTTTYNVTLKDEDKYNFMTIDLYEAPDSKDGPIFFLRGGQTSCPYEAEAVTSYYEPGTRISTATLSADRPGISVTPSRLAGIPAGESAPFNITLTNGFEDTQIYLLGIKSISNPNGAVLKLNGLNPHRSIMLEGGESAVQQLTVERGAIEYLYEDIVVRFASECDENVLEEVSISVEFEPETCSIASFISPTNGFIVNNNSQNVQTIVLTSYNLQNPELQKIDLEYKSMRDADWVVIESLYPPVNSEDRVEDRVYLSSSTSFTTYEWDVEAFLDGNYDLRAVVYCTTGAFYATSEVRGVFDRVTPRIFGTPSPADGILSAEDEISVRFNEPIDASLISPFDVQVVGLLNGGQQQRSSSVFMDGENDKVEIPDNSYLYRRSFTLEFWFKRSELRNQKQVLFAQGDHSQSMQIFIDENNKINMSINQESFSSTTTTTDNLWHHLAVSFDNDMLTGTIYIDSQAEPIHVFNQTFLGQGPITLGADVENTDFFNGNIYDLRIWGNARSISNIVADRNIRVAPSSPFIFGNWLFDEVTGTIAVDRIRQLNATVSAEWSVEPESISVGFDGVDDYLELSAGDVAISNEQSFTIEMWFKSSQEPNHTMLSNGRGDGSDTNPQGWSIGTNDSGNLTIQNNGMNVTLSEEVSSRYLDNNWHHLAVVLNRFISLNVIVDGEILESVTPTDGFEGFGGGKLWLGSLGWYEGSVQRNDQFFNGNIDEVRIWNMAKTREQIKRNMRNRQRGTEMGLLLYMPFEQYEQDAGINILRHSVVDIARDVTPVSNGGVTTSEQSAKIKLPRPIEYLNFTYSVNQDQMIIAINEPLARIENTILDISVSRIRDLNGNVIQSPITWTAFIDRNQVIWKESKKSVNVTRGGDPEVFTVAIDNRGGRFQPYEVSGIPKWLQINPSRGTIMPSDEEDLSFTVSKDINVGSYIENITLTSYESGIAVIDNLLLDVNVQSDAPEFEFDPAAFQYNMEIIAQVRYNDFLLNQLGTIVIALVNGEFRGVTELQYQESVDTYFAILQVHSNEPLETNAIVFKVWNPNTSLLHIVADPVDLTFSADRSVGSLLDPIELIIESSIADQVHLEQGWNWVSFGLDNPNLTNTIFSGIHNPSAEDVIKSQSHFVQYSENLNAWHGTIITDSDGIQTGKAYKIKVSSPKDFLYYGGLISAENHPIDIVSGWNWIGVYGQTSMEINAALSSYHPKRGDLIKELNNFSTYGGDGIGWFGSLNFLNPGDGYLLKTVSEGQIIFPTRTDSGGRLASQSENKYAVFENANDYENNMNIIAVLKDSNGDDINMDDKQVKVYIKGEYRGVGTLINQPLSHKKLLFITAFGNDAEGDDLDFEIHSDHVFNTVNSGIKFSSDVLLGTIDNPYVITVSAPEFTHDQLQHMTKVYPNPFNNHLTVSMPVHSDTDVIIELSDLFGRVITSKVVKAEKVARQKFDLDLSPFHMKTGNYLLIIKTETDFITKLLSYSNN